jgi:hypothetical protein
VEAKVGLEPPLASPDMFAHTVTPTTLNACRPVRLQQLQVLHDLGRRQLCLLLKQPVLHPV